MAMSDHEKNEKANRDLAQQRLNMGKDPGGSYADLNQKYQNQKNNSSSGGGGGCFPKGTKICTPEGNIDIANLNRGDYVISFDKDTGAISQQRILKVKSHTSKRIWLIEFDDGSNVKTTEIHSFRTSGSWKKASNIKPGDSLEFFDYSDGVSSKVVSKSVATKEVEDVFNLIVQDTYNFVAGGVVAHSFTNFRSVRVFAWSILSGISRLLDKLAQVHFAKIS